MSQTVSVATADLPRAAFILAVLDIPVAAVTAGTPRQFFFHFENVPGDWEMQFSNNTFLRNFLVAHEALRQMGVRVLRGERG